MAGEWRWRPRAARQALEAVNLVPGSAQLSNVNLTLVHHRASYLHGTFALMRDKYCSEIGL